MLRRPGGAEGSPPALDFALEQAFQEAAVLLRHLAFARRVDGLTYRLRDVAPVRRHAEKPQDVEQERLRPFRDVFEPADENLVVTQRRTPVRDVFGIAR